MAAEASTPLGLALGPQVGGALVWDFPPKHGPKTTITCMLHVLDYLGSRDMYPHEADISHMGVAYRGVHMTSSRMYMYVRRPGSHQSIMT